MVVVEKTEGEKISYAVEGNVISFRDGELIMNLAKYERDSANHIDICLDHSGCLVCGAAAGQLYVAEIDIPARSYEEVEAAADEDEVPFPVRGESTKTKTVRQPIPFDMNRCTLVLWGKGYGYES